MYIIQLIIGGIREGENIADIRYQSTEEKAQRGGSNYIELATPQRLRSESIALAQELEQGSLVPSQ